MGKECCRSHAVFIHVGLAYYNGACFFQTLDRGGCVRGNEIDKHFGGGRGTCPSGAEVVLDGDGDPVEGG